MAQNGLKNTLKRLFYARNIIVISDHKVDHYPISMKIQMGIMMLAAVGLCWIVYATGTFVTSESRIRDRDEKIQIAEIENKKMEQKFSLLKRDLSKLNIDEKSLSDYDRYILEQYTKQDPSTDFDQLLEDKAAENGSAGSLTERIAFLETRVEELQNANENLIDTVRTRTHGKIAELEEIIRLTGLDSGKLARTASVRDKLKRDEAGNDKRGAEGGPYVPFDISGAGREKEVVTSLDRVTELQTVVDMLPLGAPLKNYDMRSPFGKRVDPFTRRWAMHTGMDLAGPDQAKIQATNGGVVTAAGRNGAYGIAIDVDHGMGLVTRYGHLSRVLVNPGQRVAKGQVIGIQGSTGRSTGPHLHYEVRYNDKAINPRKFVEIQKHVLKN